MTHHSIITLNLMSRFGVALNKWRASLSSMYYTHCLLYCTFMESTAEVWTAVSLILTSAARLSFCCILSALTPNTQLFTTALIILSTGLKQQKKVKNDTQSIIVTIVKHHSIKVK